MCSAYHYPHRIGSGSCIHHPDYVKRQFEANTGLRWDGSNEDEVISNQQRTPGHRRAATRRAS